MKNKKPLGIIIVGIFALINACFYIPAFFMFSQETAEEKAILKQGMVDTDNDTAGIAKAGYVFTDKIMPSVFLILGILWLATGIGTLNLKNSWRISYITLCCFAVSGSILSINIIHLITSCIYISIIYFLTRTRIKEIFV